MSQSDEQIAKYKELYALSIDVLKEEDARSMNLENKASKYTSAIMALFGGFAFFAEKLIKTIFPINSFFNLFVMVLLIVIIVFAIIAIYFFFLIQKQRDYKIRPVDIEFFDKNNLLFIYRSLAVENKKAALANRPVNDAKSKNLDWGHRLVIVALTALFLLLIMFGIRQSIFP